MTRHGYHFIESGLDNVYLRNGFRIRRRPRGDTISFDNLEGLLQAIAEWLVSKATPLTKNEVRFLRDELRYSQKQLGAVLGVDQQTVAAWEDGSARISGPADKMMRILYREMITP